MKFKNNPWEIKEILELINYAAKPNSSIELSKIHKIELMNLATWYEQNNIKWIEYYTTQPQLKEILNNRRTFSSQCKKQAWFENYEVSNQDRDDYVSIKAEISESKNNKKSLFLEDKKDHTITKIFDDINSLVNYLDFLWIRPEVFAHKLPKSDGIFKLKLVYMVNENNKDCIILDLQHPEKTLYEIKTFRENKNMIKFIKKIGPLWWSLPEITSLHPIPIKSPTS